MNYMKYLLTSFNHFNKILNFCLIFVGLKNEIYYAFKILQIMNKNKAKIMNFRCSRGSKLYLPNTLNTSIMDHLILGLILIPCPLNVN